MKSVSINSVSKSYGGEETLSDFSLEIADGEQVAILGPSGCGKTTLLRLVAGFIAPDSGEIRISGELASAEGRVIIPPERRGVGMVFQDLALWPHLSVKGNIEFALKAQGISKSERRRKIKEILRLVGLEGLDKRKPDQLSGGQRQRVALARALAPEPGILLMDEPLASLDADLSARLRKEIKRLQNELGFTLLYVTHDHQGAAEIADRVVTISAT